MTAKAAFRCFHKQTGKAVITGGDRRTLLAVIVSRPQPRPSGYAGVTFGGRVVSEADEPPSYSTSVYRNPRNISPPDLDVSPASFDSLIQNR